MVKNEEQETLVDVIFRPNPGSQYKLTELAISGNKALSTGELQKLIHAQIGGALNVIELQNDLAALEHLYATRGYMVAAIKVRRDVDDGALSVKYGLTISEGAAYTMGDLDIHGLDSRTTAEMQTIWTLRTGDLYNADYPQQFVKQVNSKVDDWNIVVHESVNPQDKTVDVTLRFDPKP